MGRHTWFSIPVIKGKEEVKILAQKYLDRKDNYLSESFKKMYQYAIDNELHDPVCDLAEAESGTKKSENWTLYKDVEQWSIEEYNKKNETNYDYMDSEMKEELAIEWYGDSPRIKGYPPTIIRSYNQMIKAIETGLEGEVGNGEKSEIFNFQFPEGEKDIVMRDIKTFFDKHPDGIITFG